MKSWPQISIRKLVWLSLPFIMMNAACGMVSDDDDALFYDSYFFTGRLGADDFHDCYVDHKKGGLEKVYISIEGKPGKRLADLKWEDFGPQTVVSETLSVAGPKERQTYLRGTANEGMVRSGVAEIMFVDGKVKYAHLQASHWGIGSSATGPFIVFSATVGKGPTRKQIEAAFGKPARIGTTSRTRAP